jgi:hypothetical protein
MDQGLAISTMQAIEHWIEGDVLQFGGDIDQSSVMVKYMVATAAAQESAVIFNNLSGLQYHLENARKILLPSGVALRAMLEARAQQPRIYASRILLDLVNPHYKSLALITPEMDLPGLRSEDTYNLHYRVAKDIVHERFVQRKAVHNTHIVQSDPDIEFPAEEAELFRRWMTNSPRRGSLPKEVAVARVTRLRKSIEGRQDLVSDYTKKIYDDAMQSLLPKQPQMWPGNVY